ncbi:MAG: Calx-beta domain-containing protein, partial [Litorilinea sp.]
IAGDSSWAYAQVGNGGFGSNGDLSGNHGVYAQNVTVQGGASYAWAQVGNGGFWGSALNGELSGSMTISATQAVTVAAGQLFGTYALVGNGGYEANGNKTGDHTVRSGTGNILFQAGDNSAWVLLGNGGFAADGSHDGNHTAATQAGDVIFRGGDFGSWTYALVGNGGNEIDGDQSGDHLVSSVTGNILFEGGEGNFAFAQVGNGGHEIAGNHSGSHTVQTQSGNIEFRGGPGQSSWAQAGNGGLDSTGTFGGSHHVETQDGDILFTGGGSDWTYAQVGNGGTFAEGSHSGNHSVQTANGDITFLAGSGSDAYAQVGNGGYDAYGSGHSGDHSVRAENGDVTFRGGSVRRTYAQVGNGGIFAGGNHSGNHSVYAENVTFQGGDSGSAYAQVGNGGYTISGVLTGTITISATHGISLTGGSANFTYAQAGHGGNQHQGNIVGDVVLYSAMGDIVAHAGTGQNAYTQVGSGGNGYTGTAHGNHSLTAAQGYIVVTGGAGAGSFAYAVVGNGGYHATNVLTGDHTLWAAQHITFTGGTGQNGFARAGNGGTGNGGTPSGNHTLTAQSGDITFLAGTGDQSHAQAGNGGGDNNGAAVGDLQLTAGRTIYFAANDAPQSYAQAGNGGYRNDGRPSYNGLPGHSGFITLTAQTGDIVFLGGDAEDAYAHAGNGGRDSLGAHSGNVTLLAFGEIRFGAGNGINAYAQAGNGAAYGDGRYGPDNGIRGDTTLSTQTGDILFTANDAINAYALAGNGGWQMLGNTGGNVALTAAGDVRFSAGGGQLAFAHAGNAAPVGGMDFVTSTVQIHALGGDVVFTGGAGQAAYAQIGHGGYSTYGDKLGDVTISASGTFTIRGGDHPLAYAQVGHGAAIIEPESIAGERRGDIRVLAGSHIVADGARIGHYTYDGVASVLDADTYVVAGQNDPFSTGSGSITASDTPTFTTIFNSAPPANGGQLRFYVPRRENVNIDAATPMNGEAYPGTVPDNRTVGFFLFANGGYIDEYSFYFGQPSDLGVVKQVTPMGTLLPNQPITYTLAFSNSGLVTATQTVLTDTLIAPLYNLVIEETLDAGVIITQTGALPNLAWDIGDLAPGAGGEITISGQVTTSMSAPVGWFNHAGITGTHELTFTNNVTSVASNATPPTVTLSPTATIVLENAGLVELHIVLNAANPWLDTVVSYVTADDSASAGSDYSAQSVTATIPAGQTDVTISVPILDDAQVEDDELFFVTLTGSPATALGGNITAQVTILNDDSAGIALTGDTLTVSEDGTLTDVFTLTLSSQPGAPVTFTPLSGDPVACTVAPTPVTVQPADWQNPIVFTVTGVDDDRATGDRACTLTVSSTSDDSDYNQPTVGTVNVTVLDDDTGSVTIQPSDSGFTLTLESRPTAPVTFNIVAQNPDQCTVSPAQITVQPDDWQNAIEFSVDAVSLDAEPSNCVFQVVGASLDPDYDNLLAGVEVVVQPQIAAISIAIGLGVAGEEDSCRAAEPVLMVKPNTDVIFCFEVENTGSALLVSHTLVGTIVGTVFEELTLDLAPGMTHTYEFTRTAQVSETHSFTWSSVAQPGISVESAGVDSAGLMPAANTEIAQAVVAQAVVATAGSTVHIDIDGTTNLPVENQPEQMGPIRLWLPNLRR